MKENSFALRLHGFLGEYLPGQRNASEHTIISYSQTFVLLLEHFRQQRLPAHRVTLEHFTAETVLAFLRGLEEGRGNGIATRNQRLAAIHSFARYLITRETRLGLQWHRIIDIKKKRGEEKWSWVMHLDVSGMKRLLAIPDRETRWGRRDVALLSLLYDTGVRVQELINLSPGDIRLEPPAHAGVLGKGRKGRLVPLLPATAELLTSYMREWRPGALSESREVPLFFNHRRAPLTRWGIRWIVRKYAHLAGIQIEGPETMPSPHTFRHSKAMHLLGSGASLAEVQSLLGHENISSTLVYAHASMEMTRKALEKMENLTEPLPVTSWNQDRDLMNWLKDLCQKRA